MKKTILSRLLPTGQFGKSIKGLMLLLLMMFTTQGAWAVYSGTPETPQQISAENYAKYGLSSAESVTYNGYYAISSAEELYGFAALVNGGSSSANAILTDNILVNDTTKGVWKSWGKTAPKHSWTPIGNYTTPYQGTFNGRGHTIAGLYHSSEDDLVGLFGLLVNASESKICNVGILASYLKGQYSVGGVCGMCGGGIITNCYSTASVSASGDNASVGGVCGEYFGTISNCYSIATVSASGDNAYAGSIYGDGHGDLSNCYYLNDTDDGNGGKTKDQFRSGEVAWLLQGDQKEDVWGQNIGTDTIPVFGGKKVYTAGGCLNKPVLSNNANEKIAIYHSCSSPYDKGFNTCTICKHEVYEIPNQTNGIYQIANAGQLYWFAALVNNSNKTDANAILTADILVNDTTKGVWKSWGTTAPKRSWTPIGNEYMRSYIGTFNGKGHTIAGLYHSSEDNLVGLFGYTHQIDKNVGKIDSVGVLASYLKGNDYVGGVCGENGGIVSDCYSTATVSASANYASVGGVCGYNSATLCNCYNTSAVSASADNSYVGGICGYNSATLCNCYSTGAVSASGVNSYVGGVCGKNYKTLNNCYCVNETQICGSGDATDCAQKTRNQFKSGEVTYLLQQWVEANKASYQNDKNITLSDWGQKIGTDTIPVFGGQKVYAIGGCPNAPTCSNVQPTGTVKLSHVYNNKGNCKHCGILEPATPVYAADGTTVDHYEIANAGQLYWFASLVNDSNKTDANAILTANIEVNNTTDWEKWNDGAKDSLRAWTPIGKEWMAKYAGTFNGKGHTIAGLYHSSDDDYVGLFGYVVGKIDSVGVLASCFKGISNVGGVCGYSEGTISNCYSTGAVSASDDDSYVGGVCGYNNGSISNCYSTATVSASGQNSYVGGVCGLNNSTLCNCYSTATVSASGQNSYVGGVCGDNNIISSNCYSTGAVSASGDDSYVGGVCGDNWGMLSNCYCLNSYDKCGNGDATGCAQKTRDQFKSGEVAYLLQQWVEANKASYQNITLSDWGQKIGTDNSPVLGGKKVFIAGGCPVAQTYSNTQPTGPVTFSHDYDHQTGFCTYCDAAFEPAKPVYASDGTTVDHYEIANAGQLYWFASLVNDSNKTDANAILTADIVVNNTTDWEKWDDGAKDSLRAWTPIDRNYMTPYIGTFNGKGHTIAGLYHSSEDEYVGLFGYSGGTIDSVGVLASYLKGKSNVGGVCGDNEGTVSNSYSTVTVSAYSDYAPVGGVCGYNDGTLSNCYSTATVSASGNNAFVGGVCGNNSATICNCYSTSAVSASGNNSYVGGVCGNNNATITNCYSLATVSANGNYVGGVCGNNLYKLSNCFCLNSVEVYGYDKFGTSTNCAQKTRDQFKSGEVAYLLQQWVEANKASYKKDKNIALSDWGQKIDTDTIPMFSSDTVYAYINCIGNAAYTNNKELDGTSGSHEYTALIPSVNPVVDGLYSMVCKHNHDHKILNKRVIKNFDGIHNLELIYEEGKGYANDLYVEQVSLTDGNDLNIPVAFTAKEINYNRVADKDIMTIIFPCDVPANKVNGEAYLLSKYDGDKTLLYKKAEDMKANTPYLINGQNRTEANKSKQLIGTLTNVTVNPTTKENLNKVTDATGKATQKGSYVKETIKCTDAYDFYAFSGEKFMRATEDITTTGHRAFIELEKNSRITKSTRTNGLNIVFEDDDNAETVTSVEIFDVEVIDAVSEFGAKVNVYDIAGRAIRLNVPIENALNGLRNGIYIVNGKKVLVSEK